MDAKPDTVSIECRWCGTDVPQRSIQTKSYCNQVCYRRYKRSKIKKVREPKKCTECGKDFIPKKHNHLRCGKRCADAVRNRYLRDQRKKKLPLDPKPCQFCGQLFEPIHYRNIFCGPHCRRLDEVRRYKRSAITIPIFKYKRSVNKGDVSTSKYAAEIEAYKEAGGKITVFPTLKSTPRPNVGVDVRKGKREWSVDDVADLDPIEDIFNNNNNNI